MVFFWSSKHFHFFVPAQTGLHMSKYDFFYNKCLIYRELKSFKEGKNYSSWSFKTVVGEVRLKAIDFYSSIEQKTN